MSDGLRLVVTDPLQVGVEKYLASLYRKAGINYDNLTKCTPNEASKVIVSRPWTRIDAIGESALELLTGKKDIHKWRGSPLPLLGEQQAKVIPTIEPFYLIAKDSSLVPAVCSDLMKSLILSPQDYNLKPTLEQVEAFHADILCADIETAYPSSRITVVGICDVRKPHSVLVVPFHGTYIPALKRIFLEASAHVGQNNIQFDLDKLSENGIKIKPDAQLWDVMLMHHLIHPDEAHDLGFIASVYCQMIAWKHTMSEDMAWYNACDVDATAVIFNQLLPLLKYFKMLDLYKYISVPMAKICLGMTKTGIKVDSKQFTIAREKALEELAKYETLLPQELQPYDKAIRVRQKAPAGTLGKSGKPIKFIHIPSTERVVPWNSPKLVNHWLYETLQLPEQLNPKTKKLSSDKNALEKLFKKTGNVSIDALKRVRAQDELISNFLKEPDKNAEMAIGRIHSGFLVHGTNTGRLASSGPNMQNQPPAAKYIFVPSHPDWCFIEGDFSSLENRLAAWYANDDDRLRRMSIPGFNEHRWLASQIYKIPENEIDKKSMEYDRAKHTNHGADAGMGPRKMALQYNIPERDCKPLLLMWKTLNRASAEWQTRTGELAVSKGVLTNIFGRRRGFWNKSAYTEGIRFMLQGSGADICMRAMVSLMYERIDWPVENVLKVCTVLSPLPQPARLVLQVHDSLLVECPYAIRHDVLAAMKKAMEQPYPELAGYTIPVAFKVGEPGQSWAEVKERD